MTRVLCLFALTLGILVPAVAKQSQTEKPAPPARAEVLVLGVYHMANPGRDVFIRIYANLLRLADSPKERVLVIFGFGHLGWLQHDIASNPDLRLRTLSEFTE
jgi:hypothetical protein